MIGLANVLRSLSRYFDLNVRESFRGAVGSPQTLGGGIEYVDRSLTTNQVDFLIASHL